MSKYEFKVTTTAIILILLTAFNLFANIDTNIKVTTLIDNIRAQNDSWDEASIIIDNEEIVRGQIDYYYTDEDNETTLYFSDGNVWTTNVNNVLIQHRNN